MTPECPTPEKRRYATQTGAEAGARQSRIGVGTVLYPYPCPCSWWHNSKTPPLEPLDLADTDPHRVQYVRALPDIAFRTIVVEDATGKAATPDRLALRHHTNLKRWERILNQLINDASKQIADIRKDTSLTAHDQRRRTEAYRAALHTRRDECQQHRANTHLEPVTRTERDTAAADKADHKERRRLAGEAAVKRLIDAHGPEWTRYLTEECERRDTPVPDRVHRRLTASA
ncbi:hypothetical protein [Streptomyces sp. NPDC047981]|uniref:hypothetical protein n=1 Tax=Streptomyces sp. NPDC047981 TaxID=3154610 RepID=UPI003422A447